MSSERTVAVATCNAAPDLDGDGPLLLGALEDHGLAPEVQVWDAPGVDWSRYDVVLVRSTWDYVPRLRQFLGWAAGCRRTANPHRVLAWNTDKRYLDDLSSSGVPVVPTIFLRPGEALALPTGWEAGDIVVKPVVSASAADTGRFAAGAVEVGELVDRLHRQDRVVMVQPYQSRVDAEGETSLIYLGGQFSHAVVKAALLTGHGVRAPVVGDDALESITSAVATTEQQAVAARALAAVPGGAADLSYARVDLVIDDSGTPIVLELELTEPSLFLQYAPTGAAHHLAIHLTRMLA